MKKYNILLAITALIIASLACQTLMGGGDNSNDTQVQPLPPVDNGGDAQSTEESTTDSGDATLGNESPFPMPSDAFNVASTADVLAYQTNLSSDDVIKFYQDEFGKAGYTEDASFSMNFNGVFTLAFNGHESGKQILVAGAPTGDGSVSVTVTFQ